MSPLPVPTCMLTVADVAAVDANLAAPVAPQAPPSGPPVPEYPSMKPGWLPPYYLVYCTMGPTQLGGEAAEYFMKEGLGAWSNVSVRANLGAPPLPSTYPTKPPHTSKLPLLPKQAGKI